ncbi:peptidase inhibitor family I36 protein [Streptosporangium canum]|uniref:peptidase inhibitor family I36 protein n=1 Tax=Streptosporangium canum TaxID=324952 RepID=UPI0036B4BC63
MAFPQGYVCLWTEDDFDGEMFGYKPVSYYCDIAPAQPVRTIFNNTNRPWVFYRDSTAAPWTPPSPQPRQT